VAGLPAQTFYADNGIALTAMNYRFNMDGALPGCHRLLFHAFKDNFSLYQPGYRRRLHGHHMLIQDMIFTRPAGISRLHPRSAHLLGSVIQQLGR